MVIIHKCKEGDFEQVLRLLAQLWPEKVLNEKELRQVFIRGLKSNLQHYVCARIETNVIGFASLTIKNNLWQQGYIGHIDELIVDKQHRSRGIGNKLLSHITKLAKKKCCRCIELDSAFERKAAHKFYEHNGFNNRGFVFSKEIRCITTK